MCSHPSNCVWPPPRCCKSDVYFMYISLFVMYVCMLLCGSVHNEANQYYLEVGVVQYWGMWEEDYYIISKINVSNESTLHGL